MKNVSVPLLLLFSLGYVLTTSPCTLIPSWLRDSMTKTRSRTITKVVGGSNAPEPIPYQVHVTIVYKDGRKGGCGGTILDEETILSAAHCYDPNKYGSEVRFVHVEAGITETPSISPRSSNVDWTKHPSYRGKRTNWDHDIAILKMKRPLNLDWENVYPACLPGPSISPEDKEVAVVSGWGSTNALPPGFSGATTASRFLKSVAVPVLSRSKCKSMNDGFSYLTRNQFCAGFQNGGKDSCTGDSGGPLVVKGSYNKAIVYGIVSHGRGCAWENRPGVYIRVDKYLSWIKKKMKKTNTGRCPNDNNYKEIDNQCLYFHEEDGYYDYERSKEICESKRGKLVEAKSISHIRKVHQQAFNTRKDTRCFFWGSINSLPSDAKFGYDRVIASKDPDTGRYPSAKDCKILYSCADGEDDVSFVCTGDGALFATGPVCEI